MKSQSGVRWGHECIRFLFINSKSAHAVAGGGGDRRCIRALHDDESTNNAARPKLMTPVGIRHDELIRRLACKP